MSSSPSPGTTATAAGDSAVLRGAIEQAVVAYSGIGDGATRGADELLALIDASDKAAGICTALRESAVAQVRRSGVSWAAVGDALGISRQAAQQRFAADSVEPRPAAGLRRIEGATAFNEMQILAREGEAGYHLVGFGALSLTVKASGQRWEHRRELALNIAATRARLERAGWTWVGAWFPFHYFKRPRDRVRSPSTRRE